MSEWDDFLMVLQIVTLFVVVVVLRGLYLMEQSMPFVEMVVKYFERTPVPDALWFPIRDYIVGVLAPTLIIWFAVVVLALLATVLKGQIQSV